MNKFAIVTGASSGIGLEFAGILAADGYDLLLCARNKSELSTVARQLDADHSTAIDTLALDLSSPGSANKLWNKAAKRNVNVLINNAGFGDLALVQKSDEKKLVNMINLNITTLTQLSRLGAIHMKSGSKILNVASIAGFIPGAGMATYYATKAYVVSFTEALSEELKPRGISVTALCPGPTQTGFSKAAGADKSGLFSGTLPTAKQVAQYGYASMNNQRVIAVHGFKNKILALALPKLVPRSIVRKIASQVKSAK